METMKLVLPLNEEMTAIRRHIHQHPELSNEEFETTKLIREKLTEYGIEIAEIGLKTGVLGILRGKKPGKTVAIREDIDALPMPELTELPFASEIPNVCHSCGHDIHTTVLLYCRGSFPRSGTSFLEPSCSFSSRPRKRAAVQSSSSTVILQGPQSPMCSSASTCLRNTTPGPLP